MLFRIIPTLKHLLTLHAFSASALQELRNESIQYEMQLLSSDEFSNGVDSGMQFSQSFVYHGAFYGACLFIGWTGLYTFYGPNSTLTKLKDIQEFEGSKKKIKSVIILFICLFFRNLENAI